MTTPLHHATTLDADFRTACARTELDDPFHGAFALQVGDKLRQYRVGKRALPDHRIIPWQHPYARAFYEGKPGDAFEHEPSEATGQRFQAVEGTIAHLARITARERALSRVVFDDASGRHVVVRDGEAFVLDDDGSRGRERQHGLPDVLALLTPEQYRFITHGRGTPLILQGCAGSGKTTVALHRVAWLTHPDASADEPPVDPKRVLVVMFNKALSTFVEQSLAPLGLQDVVLDTFHAWALKAIRRAYRGEISPKAIHHPDKEIALALKRQVGVLSLLSDLVDRQEQALIAWMKAKLTPYRAADWIAKLEQGSGPVVGRVDRVRRELLTARAAAPTTREANRLDQVYQTFRRAKERLTQYKEELLRVLTDREGLEKHLRATPAELDALVRYQRALQGEGGTDRRPGSFVGFEDFALLLRILQLKHGGLPDKDRDDAADTFDHLVIDEAQDFGAVELRVLLGAVRSRTGVTVVGDLNQKIIPEADFIGWDALASELGLGGASVARLEVPHRSTRPIVELAATIAGGAVASGRPGPTPTLTLVEDEAAALAEIARLATAARSASQGTHVCVVLPSAADAKRLQPRLADALPGEDVRLGHNADFRFAPGITVTNRRQIKGLEFDTVIIIDPTAAAYPDDDQGRRWLYTAVTRAKDALSFVTGGTPTPLLDAARERGLLVIDDRTAIEQVAFTEEDEAPF